MSSEKISPSASRIVAALTPFLLDVLDQGLALKTVRRHRDNLWLLCSELIRRRYDDVALAAMEAATGLQELIEEDGGPLVRRILSRRFARAESNSRMPNCIARRDRSRHSRRPGMWLPAVAFGPRPSTSGIAESRKTRCRSSRTARSPISRA
jgi:hypothetical protein